MSILKKAPSFNDSRFFPNKIYEDDEVIINEFKTYDELMKFPIKYSWNIDEAFEEDFYYVKNEANGRFITQFNKNEPLNSSVKFVLRVVVSLEGVEEEICYDMNNMRLVD